MTEETAPGGPRPLALAGRIGVLLLLAAGLAVAVPTGVGLLWFVPYAGVGALLVIRRPRTSIGWLLFALAFMSLALFTGHIDATVESFADGSLSLATTAYAVWWSLSGPLTFVLYTALAMVFPSGRLPGGPWGRGARAALAFVAASALLTAVAPTIAVPLVGFSEAVNVANPLAVLPELPIWRVLTRGALWLPVFPVFAAAGLSLVVRAWRSVGIERQQLRWIGAALALVLISIAVGFVVGVLVPGSLVSGLAWVPAMVAFPMIPLAIGVAVLRYRLYDIDLIINRAIVYALLTAILTGSSAAAIALVQRLFSGVVGSSSDATVVVTTLVVVTAFNPVKTRLQSIVDRRFKGTRDPEADLAAFVAEVHESLSRPDPDRTLRRFLEVVVLAFGASGGELKVHGSGRDDTFAVGVSREDETVRAAAAVGNLRAEIRLYGSQSPHGASAVEPALVGVLEDLVPIRPVHNVRGEAEPSAVDQLTAIQPAARR